jgi:hypothetical protein
VLCFVTTLFPVNAVVAAKKLSVEYQYEKALSKAQQEDKILLLLTVKENCYWCDKIIDHSFTHVSVQKELQKFVTVIIDRDGIYPQVFKEDFSPAIFYIDPKTQKSFYESIGYIDAASLLNDLYDAQSMRENRIEGKRRGK